MMSTVESNDSGGGKHHHLSQGVPSCSLLAKVAFFACYYTAILIWKVSTSGLIYQPLVDDDSPVLPAVVQQVPCTMEQISNDASLSNPNIYQQGGVITIGFATTITGCGSNPYTDGAAVLKHTIHQASIHGDKGGRYDYKLYAFHHPNATSCAEPLAKIGYTLLERKTPVEVSEIQGSFLRGRIAQSGCCGEKELIKLEAYTLTQHPIVVHLDLDVIILKPMDAVFDLMLQSHVDARPTNLTITDVPLMWPDRPLPRKINAFWTKDYAMARRRKRYKPTQGGFLILRPSLAVYEEFLNIVRIGNYDRHRGWEGKHIGPFYGGVTIQGLIPYYYEYLHVGQGIELNRCVYNNMADNPMTKHTMSNDTVQGKCLARQKVCEDCRARNMTDIVSAHFTNCYKPWSCSPNNRDSISRRLCRKLTNEWYRMRSDMEKTWGRNGTGNGQYDSEHFFGYCNSEGNAGYQWIELPDEK